MSAVLLMLLAAAAPPHGARLQATATARIVSGERIDFDASPARTAEAVRLRQRSRILRIERDGGRSELRLVEFQ